MLNTLVITGASLGARTVNEAVLSMIKGVSNCKAGKSSTSPAATTPMSVRNGYRELGIGAVVIDFTPAMSDVWAVADLCISRSGASSCAELTACGVPSILLPYPFHRDMHQRLNAKVLATAGAAVLVDDEKDRRKKNAETLKPAVESLLYDATKRQSDVRRRQSDRQTAGRGGGRGRW